MELPPVKKEADCAEWFRESEDLLKHILSNHLQLPPAKRPSTASSEDKMDIDEKPARPPSTNGLPNGTSSNEKSALGDTFEFEAADSNTYTCGWADCPRKSSDFEQTKGRTILFVRHIQTHLPDPSTAKLKHNLKPDSNRPSSNSDTSYMTTLLDEKNDAAGVPLGAALVLRNIAKFMPKPPPAVPPVVEGMREVLGGSPQLDKKMSDADRMAEKEEGKVMTIFDEEVREKLFYAVAHNRTNLREYVGAVLAAVRAGAG